MRGKLRPRNVNSQNGCRFNTPVSGGGNNRTFFDIGLLAGVKRSAECYVLHLHIKWKVPFIVENCSSGPPVLKPVQTPCRLKPFDPNPRQIATPFCSELCKQIQSRYDNTRNTKNSVDKIIHHCEYKIFIIHKLSLGNAKGVRLILKCLPFKYWIKIKADKIRADRSNRG